VASHRPVIPYPVAHNRSACRLHDNCPSHPRATRHAAATLPANAPANGVLPGIMIEKKAQQTRLVKEFNKELTEENSVILLYKYTVEMSYVSRFLDIFPHDQNDIAKFHLMR
jgi:hypothetical protein